MKSLLRGRIVTAAAIGTVALLAAGMMLPPVPASANYNDPITIGFDNTTDCGANLCPPTADTKLLDKFTTFPDSTFYVHNSVTDVDGGPQAGFALTGDSNDGIGVFGFAHDSDPAIAARNDSGPGKKGAGISSVSSYGDGVFSTTNGINRSGVYGENLGGSGYGVVGRTNSSDHPAVWGDNIGGGTGVLGDGTVGISGEGSITGVKGVSTGAGDGVDGVANNNCCSAVYGLNNGIGNGVAGRADTGTGVLAASTDGTALKVSGKAKFSRSGVVVVPAGSSNVIVSMSKVTASSMILATAQETSGVAVRAAVPANPSSGKFTIYLTGSAPGGGLTVAYFVLN